MWRSEDDLSELVLSFHHGRPRDQIQAIRLGSLCIMYIQCPQVPEEGIAPLELELPTVVSYLTWVWKLSSGSCS